MVKLKERSDRSDKRYWDMQDDLRTEGFTNLCRQERLSEKRFWLKRQKKKMEVTSNVKESSVRDKEEQELKIITEQLQGLKKR